MNNLQALFAKARFPPVMVLIVPGSNGEWEIVVRGQYTGDEVVFVGSIESVLAWLMSEVLTQANVD